MENNQLQKDTLKSGQIETMTNSLISTPNAPVIERWKAIMMILERHQLDKGLPPLDDRILVAKAKSWEEHLSGAGVPAGRYNEIYREAMQHYKDTAPFNVFDMLKTWRNIQERFTWVDGDGVEHIFDPGEDRRNGYSEASIERMRQLLKCGGGRNYHMGKNGELYYHIN